jgi:site-specific DNA recombinase
MILDYLNTDVENIFDGGLFKHFDFTIEALQGSTGVVLNRMNNINLDFIAPIDKSFLDQPSFYEDMLRDAMASLSILPLVRFTVLDIKRFNYL